VESESGAVLAARSEERREGRVAVEAKRAVGDPPRRRIGVLQARGEVQTAADEGRARLREGETNVVGGHRDSNRGYWGLSVGAMVGAGGGVDGSGRAWRGVHNRVE